jgi:hypothetical protein
MSTGNFSHSTSPDGTVVTATLWNGSFQNIINNCNPQGIGGYSDNVAQMQASADPGEVGSESLATSVAGELDRLRFAIAELKGKQHWYETVGNVLGDVNHPPVIGNSGFEVWLETMLRNVANGDTGPEGWRWVQSGAGVQQIEQSTSVVPTFAQVGAVVPYSLLFTVQTADASLAAGDIYAIEHRIEGHYFDAIAQRPFTLSFWVRGAKTGTHAVGFRNGAVDRSYVATYTINAANTWEYKTVSVSASPSAGTWNYASGLGLRIAWTLAAGATYQVAAGAWQTGSFVSSPGVVNEMDTVSNVFAIACPKITPGISAGQWIMPQSAAEVERSARYFQSSFNFGISPVSAFGTDTGESVTNARTASASVRQMVYFSHPMVGIPIITTYNPNASGSQARDQTNSLNCSSTTTSSVSQKGFFWFCLANAATAADSRIGLHWSADARL